MIQRKYKHIILVKAVLLTIPNYILPQRKIKRPINLGIPLTFPGMVYGVMFFRSVSVIKCTPSVAEVQCVGLVTVALKDVTHVFISHDLWWVPRHLNFDNYLVKYLTSKYLLF